MSIRNRASLWLAITLGFGLLFLVSEQNFTVDVGALEDYAPSAEEASEQASGGSMIRKIMFPAFGLAGVVLLLRFPLQPVKYGRPLLAVLGGLLLWASISFLWSIAPEFTVKRLVILYCCVFALIGVCRVLGPGDLLRMVFVVSLLFVGTSLLIELVVRQDSPFSPGYRFAGGVHPNSQAGYCSLLLISSFYLALDSRRMRTLGLAIAGAALMLLLMTKSRTSLVGGLIAVGAPFALMLPPKSRVLALISVMFLIVAGLSASALLLADTEGLSAAATLGRSDDLSNLNGRVPLWGFMLERYLDGIRWFIGNGYDAVWTPPRIEEVSFNLEWSIPNAHSVYIDTLLMLGLVGLCGVVTAVLLGLGGVCARFLKFRHPQLAAAAGLAIFAFINSFLESSYVQPTSFESFTTAAAVLMVAGFGALPQSPRSMTPEEPV